MNWRTTASDWSIRILFALAGIFVAAQFAQAYGPFDLLPGSETIRYGVIEHIAETGILTANLLDPDDNARQYTEQFLLTNTARVFGVRVLREDGVVVRTEQIPNASLDAIKSGTSVTILYGDTGYYDAHPIIKSIRYFIDTDVPAQR